MKQHRLPLARLQRQFQSLCRQLTAGGYISSGSVQDRTDRSGGGAGYQWTRKVGTKTITVALTRPQFLALKQAIANQRELRRRLVQLETLSRRIIFQTHPHPNRRKSLSPKVLGTN